MVLLKLKLARFARIVVSLTCPVMLVACSEGSDFSLKRYLEQRKILSGLRQETEDLQRRLLDAQSAEQVCDDVQDAVAQPAPGLADSDLVSNLERSTALVLVMAGRRGISMGSGFFISDDLLITNRHVVEATSRPEVLLLSRAFGRPMVATLVKVTSSSEVGAPDFALVRLKTGMAPGRLALASSGGKLSEVVAAGYPGMVIENDQGFQRLLEGDHSAAPDLNVTKGAIQSLQTSDQGTPLLLHTAAISRGNSGGPLVDACGRVVGVNTFVNVDSQQSAKVNYAIGADNVMRFVQSTGESVSLDTRPCGAKR
jgi:serine protease Do